MYLSPLLFTESVLFLPIQIFSHRNDPHGGLFRVSPIVQSAFAFFVPPMFFFGAVSGAYLTGTLSHVSLPCLIQK